MATANPNATLVGATSEDSDSTQSTTQWNVFCSQHCKMWFGMVREFDGSGVETDNFKVMHSFKPRKGRTISQNNNNNIELDDNYNSEIEHSNVYYYDDKRGTVSSSPRCGPFFYKQEDMITSDFKGVKHPIWPQTKYIFFPNGSGILFNNSAVNYGKVETCVKLFVHHPLRASVRLSVMLDYCDYALDSFKIYLENSDGWKSEYWDKQLNEENSNKDTDLGLISNLESLQTIDSNLNLFPEKLKRPEQLCTEGEMDASFATLDSSSFFDYVQTGYNLFRPTQNITLSCPKFMDPKSISASTSPRLNTSHDSMPGSPVSPRDQNRQSPFIALRWNLSPDEYSVDFVAEFDNDNRFKTLSQFNYSGRPRASDNGVTLVS